MPGDPVNPGCGYERDFRRWNGNRKPAEYARVATDPARPGKLAVQYWFYYTFNDFTDKHESDWEMAQVDFNAAAPKQALASGPYQLDLAQHGGGERGAWNDPKVMKQGTHPVTFVATGSHADYFQRHLYLGKGASTGFGCDDTRDAGDRVRLQTVLLPSGPLTATSTRSAWLGFAGRWGQKEPGLNNGPTGPATKSAWAHPITWSESLRASSLIVPGGKALGVSVTGFFCAAVTSTSTVLNWAGIHPWSFLALLGLVIGFVLYHAYRTTWRPCNTQPIRQARGGGQLLRSSWRLYKEHLRTFIGIGLVFIPVAVVSSGIQWVLFHLTGLEDLVKVDGAHGPATVFLALLIGGVGAALAAAAATAAVSAALHEIDVGRHVTALAAYKIAWENRRALVGATAWQFVRSVVLVLTVIGIPYAIFRFVRTSLYAQACVLERRSAIESLRLSAELTRGQWWHTLGFTALVDILTILAGALGGVFLLLVTSQSLTFVNIAGSVIYALAVPCAAIALTLFYFDLERRREYSPSPAGASANARPGGRRVPIAS
ncbi:MAG: hypothetical protein ACTHQQ_20060 [Solirubrobacteraceae bacterium]